MKILISFFCLLQLVIPCSAGNADLFKIDDQKINADFAALNRLENYIEQNKGTTIYDLEKSNQHLLSGMDENPDNFNGLSSTLRGGETPLGIPAFIWGFCLGIVGLVLVAVLAENKELTKKALLGCVVSGLLSLGIRIAFSIFDWGFFI
jgi:hypothetical protein